MLKRTKGRLLITLLVVTGLAGTMNDSSVSMEERKYALSFLKDTRNDLIAEVKGLSERQLNFKSPSGQLTIKDCLLQMVWNEKQLWETISAVRVQPANPEKRSEIKLTDKQLMGIIEKGSISISGANTFKQANAPWKNVDATLLSFKHMRNEHIKYMKTSTEDLRNHVVLTPAGWFDCYQYILIMAAETNRYARQIEEIKQHPKFPAK